ncbi:MAG: DUF885 family protein [Rhodothermales bacterium]|nr:DUF885 family protein [Rhodothermales bacterium]
MVRTIPLALILVLTCGLVNQSPGQSYDSLATLSADFRMWRSSQQPLNGDDITRIERPSGWLPDWSSAKIAQYKVDLTSFDRRHASIDTSDWVIANQVDYRLVGSALARVNWELNVSENWRRNPLFYIDQSLGLVFEALLIPGAIDSTRSADVIARMNHIPVVLSRAAENLDSCVPEFARLAIRELERAPGRFRNVVDALKLNFDPAQYGNLIEAGRAAIDAFELYRNYLHANLGSMTGDPAVGREKYRYFLHNVALLPFEPEEMVAVARSEWERSVAFEALQEQRSARVPPLEIFPNTRTQIAANAMYEASVRFFLEDNGILTVPGWLQHYKNLPLPDHLLPLGHHGVVDDLPAPSRLDEDAVKYIRRPSESLPYFWRATALDPRPILVHEGVPGHYFQLALSWAHDNPIRRYYYDSSANEGIGFYAEEMMLQQGFFDDSPHTQGIVYNFMRLRALRVEVDVGLATGAFSIADAAEYLQRTVPMDLATAEWEGAFYSSTPGIASSYQIGKSQIIAFLAATRMQAPERDLRTFHDFVWRNGNVPIALQQWEFLSDRSAIDRLDYLKAN